MVFLFLSLSKKKKGRISTWFAKKKNLDLDSPLHDIPGKRTGDLEIKGYVVFCVERTTSGPNLRQLHQDQPLTYLLDVFHDEDNDEVHGFLLSHGVNGNTETGQRTDTHDDVDDGMVVDSGPSVDENCSFQFLIHFPHLVHVLVINELVEFWNKFGSEKGSV